MSRPYYKITYDLIQEPDPYADHEWIIGWIDFFKAYPAYYRGYGNAETKYYNKFTQHIFMLPLPSYLRKMKADRYPGIAVLLPQFFRRRLSGYPPWHY